MDIHLPMQLVEEGLSIGKGTQVFRDISLGTANMNFECNVTALLVLGPFQISP